MNKYQEALDFLKSENVTAWSNYNLDLLNHNLDVIKELVDKATPKKPIKVQRSVVKWGSCPVCKGELRKLGSVPGRVLEDDKYCPDCGQALDWGDEDE